MSMMHLPRLSAIRWPSLLRQAAPEADLDMLGQLDGVLGDAVHRLAPAYQSLIALRFGRGLTVAQVARMTHRTKAEVHMDQLRALRALQHAIESRAS
jgi:DNA-directed RNA polymerase specialized sigma24 family protein